MSLDEMPLAERRARSALLVIVPEVAPVIGAYRRAYTADGRSVPPHITLLSPFLAPVETTASVRQRIANVADTFPSFEFKAAGVDQFPTGVMYVTIEPASPVLELIGWLRQEFPEVAPYWDQFDQVVPHITVADSALTDDSGVFMDIEAKVSAKLPMRCAANEVVLMQRVRPAPAPWGVQGRFSLNGPVVDMESLTR